MTEHLQQRGGGKLEDAGDATTSIGGETTNGAGQALHGSIDDEGLDWIVWTPDDVGDWVDATIGPPGGELFRKHRIDGPTLLDLTDDELHSLLGVTHPAHRQKILQQVRMFQTRRAKVQLAARRRLLNSGQSNGVPGRETHGNTAYGAMPPSTRSRPAAEAGLHRPLSARGQCKSSPNLGTNPSRPSSISSENRRLDDDPRLLLSTGSLTNRFSRFTNPSTADTDGLMSNFGLDSPSFSLRGSFNLSPRNTDPPSMPKGGPLGPGPSSYDVDRPMTAVRRTSPRATIGNTNRNTSQYFVNDSVLQGGSKVPPARKPPSKIKGGVIPQSSRWQSPQGREQVTPGPCQYRPRQAFLSTFK
mmetsp:Transcript_60217/g.111635  ORF Transcript_60217/g.111635 Transcript_60217/m.111635 type:complete len:358 (+) Transcript_60217:49-1122(+)